MQQFRKSDLAKRSRYYQALIDMSLLEPGVPNYNLLNDSFIIIIMPFDLFGYGKYQYTFRPRCDEVDNCTLKDGAVRIFLNTKGTNDNEISTELRDFLHYLEDTTDHNAQVSGSKRIQQIHKQVCKIKLNEEMGVRYMQAWEEKYYARQDGLEEGLKKGIEEGMEKGMEKGLEKGIFLGVQALINTCQEFHLPKEEAIKRLIQAFPIELEQAQEYINVVYSNNI